VIEVLVVGQTPPPYHGQAIAIEQLVRGTYRNVRVHHVPMRFSRDIATVGKFRLGKLAELLRVIVHVYYCRLRYGTRILYYPPAGPHHVPVYRDIMVLLCTRWLFDKTIFHFHACGVADFESRLSRPGRLLFRWAYRGADATIRSSELVPDDGTPLGSRRQLIVPLGVNDCASHGSGKPTDVPTILYAGILSEPKGVLVLLQACSSLARRGLKFRLEILGAYESPQFERRAGSLVQQLELTSHVRFRGVLAGEQKHAAFAAADVLCFPSFHPTETFGLVLIEAMSYGLPTVATRWRAVPSIVADGETGFLVDVQDPSALAERLALLIESPDLRRQMATRARRRFLKHFTTERYVARMENAFLEVAAL
jgi:glycosyltransferase involved in cell wall biosynthesis